MFGIQTKQEHLGKIFLLVDLREKKFKLRVWGDETKINIKVNW